MPMMPVHHALLLSGLLLSACGDKADDTAGDGGAETDWTMPPGGVLSLETRDGVTLAADYYPVEDASAGAVVLLHMNPLGGFQRKDWPVDFIEAINGAGWAVLNLDRRGSGDSEGNPSEAINGEGGRYDVEAAVLQVTGDGYDRVVIFAASNGTTSMIDYAAWAGGEGLPEPVALAFLTGGTYTETNTDMDDVPVLPALFAYADNEAGWSVQFEDDHPDAWSFHELPAAGHGTFMLSGDQAGILTDLLIGFVQAQ